MVALAGKLAGAFYLLEKEPFRAFILPKIIHLKSEN